MSQGIFHVNFRSNLADSGEGLVVIKDGSVNGGDANFLYRGNVPSQSGQVTTQLSVNKWRAGNQSVVNIDNFTLDVQGNVNYENGTLQLDGHVVGAPDRTISISGRKVADAI